MCSTGGIRPAAAACARISRTTCVLAAVRRASLPGGHRATARCWTSVCPSSTGPSCRRIEKTRTTSQALRRHAMAPLYEHCARALDRSLATGAHGLPLIGGGDWNDGMNRVGHAGKGESVWMAWFLITTLRRFAPVAQARKDMQRADALAGRTRMHWPVHASARPGMASGIAAPSSTMARRWARAATTSAASIRWRRAGRCCPQAAATPTARARRHGRRVAAAGAQRSRAWCWCSRRPSTRRRWIRATSRATCQGCARTAGSTRMPPYGCWWPRPCWATASAWASCSPC